MLSDKEKFTIGLLDAYSDFHAKREPRTTERADPDDRWQLGYNTGWLRSEKLGKPAGPVL